MKSIDDLGDLTGKNVLIRCDLNVPLEGMQITDDGRIQAAIPSLRKLLDRRARVIVLAHLGRPKGKPNPEFSLAPVATRLSELLDRQIAFATDTTGASAHQVVARLGDGELALLENVRFDPREESFDDVERTELAKAYAELGEVFVSDGFGVVHRKQASVYDIAKLLPHAAGDLVRTETEVLRKITQDPQRPFVVVLGGAKVSDKLAVIDNLMTTADSLLIGGGMVFTFLAAQGHEVGKSLLEADQIDACRGYLEKSGRSGAAIVLPADIVVAPQFAADAPATVVAADAIPADQLGMDIGPQASQDFTDKITAAHTVFWNGPMGVAEFDQFASGTRAVAQALTEVDGLAVVGGGDSAAAVRDLGFADDDFGHISTGGGASLEYLEGKTLPGLEVLEGDA